jgi:hypothetical protein
MVSTSLPTPSVPAGFREGDFVDVFYRISQDSGHYFPVANAASGTLRPRYGRTDGWMRAVLAEDWPLGQAALVGDLGATGSVRVRHTHQFWVNPTGELLDVSNESNMVVTVEARDVRPASDGRLTARPTLSVFVVRWGGEHTKFNNEEWGGAGASVSEQYIEWFLDKCVYATLGPDYEVCTRCRNAATPQRRNAATPRCRRDAAPTGCRPLRGARAWPSLHRPPTPLRRRQVVSAFIESGADMGKLMAGPIAASMTGRHRCGCYFLWPTSFQDGTEDQSGMVPHGAYFDCVKGFEAAGLPTRFPHPSQLYRTLLAKDWQPSMCLVAALRVPPATTVNRAAIVADPRRAAAAALAALALIRTSVLGLKAAAAAEAAEEAAEAAAAGAAALAGWAARAAAAGGTAACGCAAGEGAAGGAAAVAAAADGAVVRAGSAEAGGTEAGGTEAGVRGVAKLGFAWEAAHVIIWKGEAALEAALLRLAQQYNCTDAAVIVQDFAPNDFELRVFVVQGKPVELVYTNFARRDGDGYFRDFVKYSRSRATHEWLEGDECAAAAPPHRHHAAALPPSPPTHPHLRAAPAPASAPPRIPRTRRRARP